MSKDTPKEELYPEEEAAAGDEHPDDTDAAPLADDAIVEEPDDNGDSDEEDTDPTDEELEAAAEDPGDTPILDELNEKKGKR